MFCEDTRVTAKLSTRFGIAADRISCPAPRERTRIPELLRRLEAGETVALVSDAGMPGVSDPGERLVAAAASAGYPVVVVPGPSAPAAALAVSGLPAVPHLFLGFLPARAAERRRLLRELRDRTETLIWFEAPHRLTPSLEDAAEILGGDRRACVAREMTKIHEETVRGGLREIAEKFRSRGAGRGEATVVAEGAGRRRESLAAEEIDGEIRRALAEGADKRTVARDIASRSARPAREIYARAVALAGEAAAKSSAEPDEA